MENFNEYGNPPKGSDLDTCEKKVALEIEMFIDKLVKGDVSVIELRAAEEYLISCVISSFALRAAEEYLISCVISSFASRILQKQVDKRKSKLISPSSPKYKNIDYKNIKNIKKEN
jgi:hypothetical protein